MASNETKLLLLSSKREHIFRDIQILYDLSKKILQGDLSGLSAFKSRYKRIESVRNEYFEVVNDINTLKLVMNPNEPIDFQSLQSFDDLYYAVTAAADSALPAPLGAAAAESKHDLDSRGNFEYSDSKPTSQARLPKIELPKFDGNIEHWQTFYDTYVSLVHENNKISQIEKFHYLLSCLSGPALSVAKGIPVTADNYPIVFEALIDSFQNQRILAANYLDKIISAAPMRNCNLNDLRSFTSLIYETVNALKAMKLENLDEFILFHLAFRVLDEDTRKTFESGNKQKKIPRFIDLLSFLQGYVKIIQTSERKTQSAISVVKTFQQQDNRNSGKTFKSRSFPVNTGPYSDMGPYPNSGFSYPEISEYRSESYLEQEPNLQPGPYLNSGPYLVTGPGPYSDTGRYQNPGPYSEIERYQNPEPYSGANIDSNTHPGLYSAADTHSDPGIQFNSNAYQSSGIRQNVNRFPECVFCGDARHSIYRCSKFVNLRLVDRQNFVRSKNLCINCLRLNHIVRNCMSKSLCAKCNGRHHTLLHDEGPTTAFGPARPASAPPADGPPESNANITTVTMNASSSNDNEARQRALVLLGTCVVRARGPAGSLNVRALIDSGAQDCFMTNACAQRLGLPLRRCNIAVAGLGQNTVHQIKGITSCCIEPRDANAPRFEISPIVMDQITNQMPTAEIPIDVRESYKHLVLADNTFDKPGDIDLLIGAELFHNIYDGQRLESGPGLPVAMHSVFGWVITGKLDQKCRPPPMTTSLLVSTLTLDNVVKRFWEIEEPPSITVSNPEDDQCEQIYSKSVTRNPDGRYVVPIMLKDTDNNLGDSCNYALSRLYNLERRLQRQEQLKQDYVKFMREYSDLGHMQPVDATQNTERNIIPHHCVLRPDSSTTKLRVVFDGSAKTSNGKSINDIVYVGPKMQNDIVDIITKFRTHVIVFTADISKMYRNIDLLPQDRKYQHIFWRESPEEPVREFELNTVTYGVSSSPYLAIRTLHQLANDHGEDYPRAAEIIRHDTFMDDITAGSASVDDALKLKDELNNLLKCAQFELRKWSSNSPKFLEELPMEHCQVPKSFCDDTNQMTLKILGIQWDPSDDVFTYSVSDLNSKCTKRMIMSNIARLYDPLGWVTPVVLTAKLIIQSMWRRKLDWDDPVPLDIKREWEDLTTELQNLRHIRIPRLIAPPEAKQFELIGFCDGSTKAYGCCVYQKSVGDTQVTSHLLIAKSKVAPLKPLTVNRLELCGAALLSRVMTHMFRVLQGKLNIVKMTGFTDSSTVLAWLNTPPYKLKTFVSHRVAKITDQLCVENWFHVSTHENPADHCSRGLGCSQLLASESWWTGPRWLVDDPSTWPTQPKSDLPDTISEIKSNTHVSATATSTGDTSAVTSLLDRVSTFSRAQRVMAWCLRFVQNIRRSRDSRITSALTTEELDQSVIALVRHEQNSFLSDEMDNIKSKRACHKPIQRLRPFIDRTGMLRVGGRLNNAQLPMSTMNPLLIPKSSRLSRLLIDYCHRMYLHIGPRTLQSLIQRRFWILGIRNLIRSQLSKCVTCFKVNPTPCQPLMGDLPGIRVQQARCFQNIGVDFAGPFTVKESRRRNAHSYKVYVCVMVCLTVKAIHLEAVTELSTPAFLAALDRFVSRRGLCQHVYSDNGTNFVGAKRYLSEMHQLLMDKQEEINSEMSKRGIIWHLNPPAGSHFGGIFESGVKSMKHHLKRVVGLQVLTLEELITVLAKIEAVLNSRPLCSLSGDPSEVDVLTPGHFLIGGPLLALPERPLEDTYLPPRERWLMLQKITQSFWHVWQRDYLHTLQQRVKWFKGQASVQVGDIVTIVDQNLPPLEWRYGKIEQVHPGSDGVVRVVTLRTAKGLFKRPVTKICPLPINQDNY